MAFFVATASSKGLNRSSSSSLEIKRNAARSEKENVSWGFAVDEAPAYRRREFKKLIRKTKSFYEDQNASDREVYYIVTLKNEMSIFPTHRKPEKVLQFMIFGSSGYLSSFDLEFKQTENGFEGVSAVQGFDIGDVHALAIGYDYDTKVPSIFIEEVHLRKMISEEESVEYEIPCFRWLSTQRDDGSVFRLLWAYEVGEETLNESEIKLLKFGRPKKSIRKVKNSDVILKNNFVEHCVKFSFNDLHWHSWRRYDTFRLLHNLINEHFPELHVDAYFPEKTVLPKTKSSITERQEMLDEWIAHIIKKSPHNNKFLKSFIQLPPRPVLENNSPLSAMLTN